ncbi:hypothetical protein MPL3356_340207 [Mesorhizobium plurifarium]|uniref:Uncharacterized protein n=1 Tax=Mesorhizobium plurifarium TaxID=69974 RepID=A0A090DVY4_MESPL|nr:hypothetical protein MPL3356_340207 [Mesorhizobium plurifarium]
MPLVGRWPGGSRPSFIPDIVKPFIHAVVRATEEPVLNALVANEDMTGRDGNFVPALPKGWLKRTFGAA